MRTSLSDVRRRRAPGPPVLAVLALLVGPAQGTAQDREIVSKQIAVSESEATLHLEFDDGGELEISLFDDEDLVIDGDRVGASLASESLGGAWRALLGRAVALNDGPLAHALVEWSPPEDLDGGALEMARRIDLAMERALSRPVAAPEAEVAGDGSLDVPATLTSLLDRSERLAELAEALDGVRLEDLRIRVGEDVVVEAGEEMEGTLVVVDGDVDVAGTVRGDVVVVGGRLRVSDAGRVTGDVRLADARLVGNEDGVDGSIVNMDVGGVEDEAAMRDRIRDEVRQELRERDRGTVVAQSRDEGWSLFRPLRFIGSGITGLIATFLQILLLGLLGGGLVFFGGKNLEVVAETARRTPARAAAVGVAGAFLILPVWILGIIALAVSIIGIPVLFAWIPLFPVAVALAAALGYFAVASNVGEWLASKRYPYLDWIRSSNPYTLVLGGVAGLMAPFMAMHVTEMAGPALGFLKVLLTAAGVLAAATAFFIGFGAVLVTRAGRRPQFYRGDLFGDDDDWPDDFDGDAGVGAPV